MIERLILRQSIPAIPMQFGFAMLLAHCRSRCSRKGTNFQDEAEIFLF
jgi:hypothetical protein